MKIKKKTGKRCNISSETRPAWRAAWAEAIYLVFIDQVESATGSFKVKNVRIRHSLWL